MPEEDVPKKKGVHGWRAFLLMFGCGTMAALLVFSVVVGSFRFFTSSLSGSEGDQGDPSTTQQSREPVTTMTPGAIDLCQLISDAPPISLSARNDSNEGPQEKGAGGGDWVVSDECSWDFIGEESRVWRFDFSYKAFISSEKDEDRFEQAEEEFDNKVEESIGDFSKIEKEGDIGTAGKKAYEVFGEAGGGRQGYSRIQMNKSSVYVIYMEGNSGEGSLERQPFFERANSVKSLVENPLNDVVPD